MMRNACKIFLMSLLLTSLFALVGCGSDDPAGPATTNSVDSATAEEFAVQALDMINSMATDIPYVSAGDFTQGTFAKAGEQPEWDPQQMAWTYDVTLDLTEGDPPTTTGEIRASVWIQFRNAEGPLTSSVGATEMEYRAGSGMTMDMAEDGVVANLEFDMATTMLVAYRQDGGYDVDGTGDANVSAYQSNGSQSERAAFHMAWGMDLMLQPEGCPSGAAFVDLAPYRMDATYDGQGNAAWTFTGPNYAAEGTELVGCGQPL